MRAIIPGCFDYLNGNKKFVTLNLKHKKGVALFLKLAKNADVIVEGLRPGVAKRLGIDFDAVKAINPSIIYCSISGHGQTGPYSNLPGHDINYQGLSGLLAISGDPDKGPKFPDGFQSADLSGSMFALVSILAALNGKNKSSPPVYLDIALSESLAMWMMPRFFEYLGLNRPLKSKFMGRGPYGVFQTKDNKHITIGVVEDHFWTNLCKVLGFDDLAKDPSLKGWHTRNYQREKIVPRIKKAIKTNDADYWLKVLSEADVPVAPINDFATWAHDPQFKDRGFFPETAAKIKDKRKFRRFPVNDLIDKSIPESEQPALGKDSRQVFAELGLTDKEIDELKTDKTI